MIGGPQQSRQIGGPSIPASYLQRSSKRWTSRGREASLEAGYLSACNESYQPPDGGTAQGDVATAPKSGNCRSAREAYNQELNRFDSRSRGDALENLALSSVGAGRQEQGRLFNQDLSSRRFSAGEQGRAFSEDLAGRQFQSGEESRQFWRRD